MTEGGRVKILLIVFSLFFLLFGQAFAYQDTEMRGIWISDPTIYDWGRVVKNLKKARINNIFVNFASPGAAFYSGKYLPYKPCEDSLQSLIRIAHKEGIKVHAKILTFFLHFAPEAQIKKMKREKRLLINTRGKIAYQSQTPWIDPALPENRELMLNVIWEIVKKFDIDGIQLDYVRFFEETGVPDSIMSIRRMIVTNFVSEVSQMLRQLDPSLDYSACVFYNVNRAQFEMAQDWPTWEKRNIFTFLVPMNYTTYPPELSKWINSQLKLLKGNTPFYSGLGAYMPKMTTEKLIQQIEVVRRSGMNGFVLFAYSDDFVKKMLPVLVHKLNPSGK